MEGGSSSFAAGTVCAKSWTSSFCPTKSPYSGPIVTELRRGLRSATERSKVIPLLDGCLCLDQPARLWEEAGELGYYLSRKGVTVKSMDLLIATYALSHRVPVLTADTDFALMSRAGLHLQLFDHP